MSLRLASCLTLLIALPACFAPDGSGERAGRNGRCPTGASCTPQTPKGLDFFGASYGRDDDATAVPVTAVGGIQTIRLTDHATHAPIRAPWRAEIVGALALARQDGSSVVVRGLEFGSSSLRIVDPATGKLHDRHDLVAAPIDHIQLATGGDGPVAWFAGATISATVELVDGFGALLVDEGLQVSGADVRVEATAWDGFEVRNAAVGTHAITVSAGALRDQPFALSVVDHVDRIEDSSTSPNARTIRLGSNGLYCFDGRLGDARVLGLRWTFSFAGAAVDPVQPLDHCVVFAPIETGTIVLTAEAGGQRVERSIEVIAEVIAEGVADDRSRPQ